METSDLRFAHLLGHEKPKALLREAATGNRMSHAYLFRGPDGVGKKRAALTFAAVLNCKSPADHDACGRCSSCRKYASGNHPDLTLIAPEGTAIKIGQVRELKKQLAFPPLEAGMRVVILEDIHTMRREAANSLLKTLEEPPPGNLLILTGDQAGGILPTILSRCQVIPFGPLGQDDIARVLMEEDGMDESRALTLASVAAGSLGRAKYILQENLLDYRREVVEMLLLHRQDPAAAIPPVILLSEKLGTLKENITDFLDLLRLWYRDLILLGAGGPEAAVANRDLSSLFPEAQNRFSLENLNGKLRRIDLAERQLARNCTRTLVLETLFFDLI